MVLPYDRKRIRALIDLLAPARLTRVLDIGASPLSKPAYHALKSDGLCEVWGFEPQQEQFDKLVAESGPNEHYVMGAVGDGRRSRLNLCVGAGMSSILLPNPDFYDMVGKGRYISRITGSADFDTIRLDDADALAPPDLLKIDVQGYETTIIRHGAEKLSKTCAVITEVAFCQMYRDQPLIGDQMALLGAQGFQFHKFMHVAAWPITSRTLHEHSVKRRRNQALDGDAVFLRRALLAADGDTESVKHLAILADAVFGSADVVGRCLDILTDSGAIDGTRVGTYVDLLAPHL